MQKKIMQTDGRTARTMSVDDRPVQGSGLWQFMNNNVA